MQERHLPFYRPCARGQPTKGSPSHRPGKGARRWTRAGFLCSVERAIETGEVVTLFTNEESPVSEIIGSFSLDSSFDEHLSLTLSHDSLVAGWSLCSQTANFLAESFEPLLPETAHEGRRVRREEVSGAVSYILNELLENAVKLNQSGNINVTLGSGREGLICLVSNQITSASVPELREKLLEITTGDPEELLRRRVEENAEDEGRAGSGLGYLSIINDYGVSLGWKLDSVSSSTVCIQTMARLPV
jgi:hypothetical protein